MASNELQMAFSEIAEMRALPQDVIIDALQFALVNAYRKYAKLSQAQPVEARIEPTTGRARIYVEKEVIAGTEQDIVSEATEVTLETARYYNPEAQVGDLVMVQAENTPKSFGRIAAQSAKQVILQRIREAERNSVYNEFMVRQNDLITGTVQSMSNSVVTLSLGRAEAVLNRNQQIPGERLHPHQKLRVYVVEVKKGNKGPQIIVSRTHRNMLRRLLEYEVPEIYDGKIEIKSIAREAGYRSKVAVAALQDGIDPVGACVGMRGSRIQNIVKELNGEKIDVIEWSPSAEQFILKALSPAKVAAVYLERDVEEGQTALVIVPDDQLSLAIGREGQNARLAAKLTGWRIDIKSVLETVQGALANLDVPPFNELARTQPELIAQVTRLVEKKMADMTLFPEDYAVLNRFAIMVEDRLLADREVLRKARQKEIEAVRMVIPPQLFKLPVQRLGLSEAITEALIPFENVGQVMLSTLITETRLRKRLSAEAIADVQRALDELAVLTPEELDMMLMPEGAQTTVEDDKPLLVDEVVLPAPAAEEEPVLRSAFGGEVVTPAPAPALDLDEVAVAFDDEDDDGPRKDKKKNRRQLVYDEESGEVRIKRSRKSGRAGKYDWDADF
jgi:N utilization substance protein A